MPLSSITDIIVENRKELSMSPFCLHVYDHLPSFLVTFSHVRVRVRRVTNFEQDAVYLLELD